ncbi:hypothetical protein CGLO_05450 [Colletotrichum gloeosporioides Cg-14]|uniref:Uncharacterized protein n=1 Tax=Colletotrichum gloeosporioides (strain Cg-14) TaxID=1237896 RepID=T0KGX0_COLGC|nr:hypothetical protein CGLO_05450 [Colletotrichum gloeosporioides Cg-14]
MRATIQARDQQSIHYEHCAFLFFIRLPDLDRRSKLKNADVSASAGDGVCSGYPDSADLHTFAAKPPLSNKINVSIQFLAGRLIRHQCPLNTTTAAGHPTYRRLRPVASPTVTIRLVNSKPALSQRRQRLSGRRAVSTIVADIGTRAQDEARGVASAMPPVSIGFAVTTSHREPSSAINLLDILLIAGACGITGQPSLASVEAKRDCDATPRDRPFA